MSTIKIVVLGAGNIGGTLGRKWIAAGHQVVFGVNNPGGEKARKLRSDLGDRAAIHTTGEALATNPDVVVLAIPGMAMDATIAQYADQLDGKIIIDTANKMGASSNNSFAALQQHTPHARIYRAFNTLGWENFANPLFDGTAADLFYSRLFEIDRQEMLFVGDSLHDGEIAEREGVPFVGVATTFSPERFMLRFPQVPVVRRFAALPDLFQ